MTEEEREIVKKFERLYLKDFNNEKITNEDRLSYIECVLMSNLIEKLQKENEKALAEYMEWQKQELEQKDKIIEQMTYYIMNLDIDEDICKKVNCDTNSGELDCKDCIKQYFINKAKEIR